MSYDIGKLPPLLTQILSNATDIFLMITIPIYAMVVIVIAKNRKDTTLKHSFFTLMISLGIADICKALTLWFLVRLAGYGWIPKFFIQLGSWGSRMNMLANLFKSAQISGLFIVTLNRFTAIVLPLRHQMIWDDGKTLRYCIAGQWIYAFSTLIPIFVMSDGFGYLIQADNRTITFQWDHAPEFNFFVQFLQWTPLIIIIVLLYIVIFANAIKIKCVKGSLSSTEIIAIRMCLVGVIHTFGLVVSLFVVITTDWSWRLFRIIVMEPTTQWFYINEGNDLFCAVNPYALLIFSTAVRHHFTRMFCWKAKEIQNAVALQPTTV